MGPCAKTVVRCVLTDAITDEVVATGENMCITPQLICPRTEGEDYEKCKTVCNQVGHAEEVAVYMARDHKQPLIAYIIGHTHCCANCIKVLTQSGVIKIKMGNPL